MCSKDGRVQVIMVTFAVGARMRCVYFRALLQMEQGLVSFAIGAGLVYCIRRAHKTHTNYLGKQPNKGVLPMMLDNGEMQGSHG